MALHDGGIDLLKFKILTEIMILYHFLCLLGATLPLLIALRRLRKLFRGVQGPPGGRRDRFRPSTRAASGPEH